MPYNDSKGPKMESAKQERKDLLRDNPVVRDMDSSRPWMSKHFQSSMSPLKDGHDSPAEKELKGNQKNLNPGLRAAIEAAPEMKYGMEMRDGMEMGHEGSPAEKHCMGPRLSALENETGMSKEEMEKNKPDAPKPPVDPSQAVMIAGTGGAGLAAQKLGKIVKKIRKKPVKKS